MHVLLLFYHELRCLCVSVESFGCLCVCPCVCSCIWSSESDASRTKICGGVTSSRIDQFTFISCHRYYWFYFTANLGQRFLSSLFSAEINFAFIYTYVCMRAVVECLMSVRAMAFTNATVILRLLLVFNAIEGIFQTLLLSDNNAQFFCDS